MPPCGGHLDTNDLPELQQKFQVVPPCGGHHHASLQRATAAGFKSCPRVGGIRASDCIWLPYKVSSRAPVWGASRPVSRRLDDGQFQVVPPCGGHHKYYMAISPLACFKSCPRVGGIRLLPLCGNLSGVSSRAPVWGASHPVDGCPTLLEVSSRAPVWGASLPLNACLIQSFVSSRAPVWGASLCDLFRCSIAVVSSRAPVWGASPALPHRRCRYGSFKSCPRVGGIRLHKRLNLALVDVSSRAPVWGASAYGAGAEVTDPLFQVVPPCGGHPKALS